MDKQTFLSQLRQALPRLPKKHMDRAIDRCSARIDEKMAQDMDAEAAVAELGGVDALAEDALRKVSVASILKHRVLPDRPLRFGETLLLIVSSPLWLLLLLLAYVVLFGAYCLIWAVILALYCVELTLAVGFTFCIVGIVLNLLHKSFLMSLLMLLVGAVCAVLTLFGFIFSLSITKKAATLSFHLGPTFKRRLLEKYPA